MFFVSWKLFIETFFYQKTQGFLICFGMNVFLTKFMEDSACNGHSNGKHKCLF